ncbi:MAG: carboxypeptidase regulatory-like domain-containing protein [Gemmatimonadales bacterium]|nr:carboxypeptidase regulatory-like domain-containing protein [Gemmatimonadales bacterium]
MLGPRWFRFVIIAVALWLAPAPAAAQAGSGTDIITGVVTGEDGRPITDATVEAYSLETQVTRRAQTDTRGRFTILFPDGGGQYRMTGRVIGMAPRIELLQRHADEDRLVWNVRLTGSAVTLDPITVRAGPQIVRAPDGPTPGSTERAFNGDQLARLPTDATDLALLASLVPGVVPISATDSSATAFSVAGLGPDANALTLDGLLFGTSSIPQEGLRQTRVVTSTYDVSRGQFSGGLIASTTRSGSNVVQGSSQYQLRDDDLAVTDDSSAFAQGFSQHVISGGVGGPIVRDRLFLFGSFQARLRSDPQQTLLSANRADYPRLGVHPDSVTRFLSLVNGLGVPTASVPGGDTRSNDNLSALARLDYVLSNSHTLTLRGDWSGTSQDPTRLGTLTLPQTGGLLSTGGGGAMLTLTSRFGATLLNEARAYLHASRNDGDPFTQLPAGRVQVASDLPDSTRGVSTLVFGGNSGLPTRSRSTSFEASNELSLLPGSGGHRFKIGGSFTAERAHNVVGNNRLGTFTYNSLADLEAGRPASFRRTIGATERRSDNYRWGLYAGDVWIVRRPFQLTYGLRLEGSAFGNPPEYNPAVDSAFGRRTDRLPTEWRLSPRAGFTWTLGGTAFQPGAGFQPGRIPTPPTLVIRGGIGEFRSQPPSGLVALARSATGLALSSAEVVCTGLGVPVPTWNQYWADPGTIPDECAASGPPATGGFQPARTVTLFADGFEASRAWRGSLGVEKRLTQLFRLTIEGSFSRGVRQSGFRDLNLVSAPRFTIASEGDRPVYVAPGDITATTGAPRFNASRADSAFGQVLEAQSNLRSRSEQFTVGIGGLVFRRGIQMQTSYTWQRTQDQATGARGGSTAGDPRVVEWARSDFERRHSFLATLTYPFSQSLEITSIGRLTSGSPYTPTVGGDVNGDGSRNDRAFVFVPGGATPEAAGIQRLLAQSSSQVRECLQSQIASVAARNSCTGPWQYTLDFQLNWRPASFGLNRRLTVSVVTVNFPRGLDELLHGGADGAKGWGLATRPDNTLLYVNSFDQATQRYAYDVNERFGATAGSATAFRPPFQIGVQVRMTIGPDRMRQALDAMRAAGRRGAAVGAGAPGGQTGFRGPVFSSAEALARIESALPNPAGAVLDLKDSLGLDSAQIVLLMPLRDSLAARNTRRLDSLRAAVGTGNNPDFVRLMPILRPLFEAGRNEVAQATVAVRAILTAEQWAKLPESVRNFQLGPRPGQIQERRPGAEERRRP